MGRDKHHIIALSARFMAQRLCQVTFTTTSDLPLSVMTLPYLRR
jgi:hypothetical protein